MCDYSDDTISKIYDNLDEMKKNNIAEYIYWLHDKEEQKTYEEILLIHNEIKRITAQNIIDFIYHESDLNEWLDGRTYAYSGNWILIDNIITDVKSNIDLSI